MSFFLSADDITQAEHYTKQTVVKRWLILMLYSITGRSSAEPGEGAGEGAG